MEHIDYMEREAAKNYNFHIEDMWACDSGIAGAGETWASNVAVGGPFKGFVGEMYLFNYFFLDRNLPGTNTR